MNAIVCGLVVVLGANVATAQPSGGGAKTQEKEKPGPAAWQSDAKSADKWNEIVGRHTFARACSECHEWGPNYWTAKEWAGYFEGFPENHDPPVADRFEDLHKAIEADGKKPAHPQIDALLAYLKAEAPGEPLGDADRTKARSSLPRVGDKAPEIDMKDSKGQKFTLSKMKGQKRIILVMLRAHW
jgi:mono/diheme cytochrome c family protein